MHESDVGACSLLKLGSHTCLKIAMLTIIYSLKQGPLFMWQLIIRFEVVANNKR